MVTSCDSSWCCPSVCFCPAVYLSAFADRYGLLDDSEDEAETEAMQHQASPGPSKQHGKAGAAQQPSKASHGYGFIDDDEDMGDTDDASDQTGDLLPSLVLLCCICSQHERSAHVQAIRAWLPAYRTSHHEYCIPHETLGSVCSVKDLLHQGS